MKMSIVIGTEHMELSSVPQRPMMLHAVLVPVGFAMTRLTVGPTWCPASPETIVVEVEPKGTRETVALFTRYVLDKPEMVWPGMQVRASVIMPVLWGVP